jgi:kumamolisin
MAVLSRAALAYSEVPGLDALDFLGPCDSNQVIEIALHLRYPSGAPTAPSTGDWLSHTAARLDRTAFAERHGAGRDDIALVEQFAAEHDLTVVNVNAAARLVTLTGTVASLNQAFGVELGEYASRRHGGKVRAYVGPLTAPGQAAPLISAVEGLSTISAMRRHAAQTAPPGGSFLPTEIAGLYDFPADASGKGRSIALIELFGGVDANVVHSYFTNVLKRPPPKLTICEIAGGQNQPHDADGSAEVYLDVLIASAIAPDAEIVVYFADANRWAEAIKSVVHDPLYHHDAISYSFGQSEKWCLASDGKSLTADVMACEEALRDAVQLGITFCTSTGDLGAGNGEDDGLAHANYPASSIYALACAGTQVTASGGAITDEVVWHDGSDHASGGGVSQLFACPEYQRAAGVIPQSVNPGGATGRGAADVAGHAADEHGYYIYAPEARVMGGTSAVAPLWAGLIALLNEKLGQRVGFINPHLYQTAARSGALRDIIEGDNNTAGVSGYRAGAGWDACSGWGSPRGLALLETFTALFQLRLL